MDRTRAKEFAEVYNNFTTHHTLSDVAAVLGVSVKTVKNLRGIIRRLYPDLYLFERKLSSCSRQADKAQQLGFEFREITAQVTPTEEPIEVLLDRVMKHSDRVLQNDRDKKVLDVAVHIDGPFGVVGFPDGHLNSPGTDIRRAFKDAELVAGHPALFGVGIGDYLDNFIIGKLERERRKDIMSHSDANRILDHYLTLLGPKLIAAVSGNHDKWVEQLGGYDPLKALLADMGLEDIYGDQLRIRLNTPCGASFVHLARHNYPGRSKLNPMHGIMSWVNDQWQGESVAWGGHIHTAGHFSVEKNYMGEQYVVHGIQLPSYKVVDNYALVKGFKPNVPFTAPMIIHVPNERRSIFVESLSDGIKILNMLREEAGFV